MAKTKEELNALKLEYESLLNKLNDLSDDELIQVAGGMRTGGDIYIGTVNKNEDNSILKFDNNNIEGDGGITGGIINNIPEILFRKNEK